MTDGWRVAPASVIAFLLAATSSTPALPEVFVVCELESGDVVLADRLDEGRQVLMEGPLPGARTASVWIEESCPGRRCDAEGRCVGAGAEGAEPGGWVSGELTSERVDGGGWVSGELTSETLSAPVGHGSIARDSARGPAGARSGPGAADLGPLISNTRAAARGCSYPAAQVSVEHMANFDPQHPWYVANREKIRGLAERQTATEQSVWRASSAIQAGDWKRARELAFRAASTAVSCQAPAVAGLLGGIDTTIEQMREQKNLERRQAAARLLPSLVSLSNALTAAQSGTPVDVEALIAETSSSFGVDLPLNAIDPCAFKYEYRDSSSLEPACSCAGYWFEPQQFRCVSR